MTAAKRLEYQIVRQLLQRQESGFHQSETGPWVERLIAVLAVTAGLFILGSYLEELLWAALATATALTLR